MEPVLVAKNLSKKYGRVVALDSADLELYPGEVLGVIGDNGAGKSTLIKVLCGAVIPDSGEILLDGENVTFTSPIEARKLGIETVYQNLALSPALSITDNTAGQAKTPTIGASSEYGAPTPNKDVPLTTAVIESNFLHKNW